MELNEILAISGAPGLYKFVAQGKNGIIVESLSDQRRTMVSGATKVSALADMAVFTDSQEIPLEEVFQAIYDKNGGKAVGITGKSSPDELKKFMESSVPDYDRERVHNSDIKKIGQWYDTLVNAGMKSFKTAEEPEEKKEEGTKKAAPAKAKTATASAAAKKQAAPKKTGASSGAKAPAKRSTTVRKAQ